MGGAALRAETMNINNWRLPMFWYPVYSPYTRVNAVLLNPQPLPPRYLQSGIIVVGGR
jgi:hypothetical protein